MRIALTAVIPLAVGAGIAGAGLVALLDDGGERALTDFESTSAERLARQLEGRVTGLQRALQAAVQSAPGDIDQAAGAARFLAGTSVMMTMFTSLAVARPDGRVLALRDGEGVRTVNANVSDSPYFRRTLVQRRPQVSSPLLSRVSGAPLVAFSMPVQGADGDVAAVVIGSLYIGAADLAETLSYGIGAPGESARTVVADATGRIIAHPAAGRVMKSVDTEPGLVTVAREWLREGSPAQPESRTHREPGRLITTAGVPTARWLVFRLADDTAFVAQRERVWRHAVGWAGAVTLIGAALAWWLARRTVRPLERLASQWLATTPADGSACPGTPQRPHDCVATLERLLNRLTAGHATAGHELAAQRAATTAVMEAADVGMALTRGDVFVALNVAWATLLDYAADELIGQPVQTLWAADEDVATWRARRDDAFARGHVFTQRLPVWRKDRGVVWAQVRARPVAGADHAGAVVWTLSAVDAAIGIEGGEAPGAVDKAGFERDYQARISTVRSVRPLFLLHVDLDHFDRLNAVHGRPAGDAVLEALAARMRTELGPGDTLHRVGGDQFIVLLDPCERSKALRLAHRLSQSVQAARVPWMGARLQLACSIGVAAVDDPATSATAALAAAQAACYDAKRSGRNAVREVVSSAPGVAHGGRGAARDDQRA